MTNEEINKDIRRGLEEAFTTIASTFSGAQFDGEMEKVVEEYKLEVMHWFTKAGADKENPLKRATQEHWYSLYLEKKRLEKHNCQVQYPEYKHINPRPLEQPETVFTYKPDGKYLVCRAGQVTKVLKNYIRGGAVIGQEQKTYDIDYYIMRAQNKDGLYVCPNCGVALPLDKLLDGCDYCKSKFDISAYDDKVMSVMKNKLWLETREVSQDKTPASALVLAVVGTLAVFFGLLLTPLTLGLSLLVVLAGGWGIYHAFQVSIEANRNVPQNGSIIYRLRDHNPGFSVEEFIGSMDCKLKAIHYASNPQELAAFVKCDIAPYLKNYQNIVNCEVGRIAYKNFRVQDGYQYVELHREIKVMLDCGTKLRPAAGVVKLTLAKKLSHRLKNDVTLCRCTGCGATVSLVEGGKCKYCGMEMDYSAYDWVVTEYRHVKSM